MYFFLSSQLRRLLQKLDCGECSEMCSYMRDIPELCCSSTCFEPLLRLRDSLSAPDVGPVRWRLVRQHLIVSAAYDALRPRRERERDVPRVIEGVGTV